MSKKFPFTVQTSMRDPKSELAGYFDSYAGTIDRAEAQLVVLVAALRGGVVIPPDTMVSALEAVTATIAEMENLAALRTCIAEGFADGEIQAAPVTPRQRRPRAPKVNAHSPTQSGTAEAAEVAS